MVPESTTHIMELGCQYSENVKKINFIGKKIVYNSSTTFHHMLYIPYRQDWTVVIL